MLKLFENFLDNEELKDIEKSLINGHGWKFGQTSNTDSKYPFWVWDLRKDPYYTDTLFDKVKSCIGMNVKLTNVYANGQTHGLSGNCHIDSDTGYTFLIYANPKWEFHWGGMTVFNGNKSVMPVPGRAVLFPANIKHVGLDPSKNFTGLRVTIAYKLEEIK